MFESEVSNPLSDGKPLLELKGVSKAFGAIQALRGVELSVRRGEVHALIGENGAGKSTLMKILSGAHRADQGQLFIDGQPIEIDSPATGRALGIAMIYQELNLAPHLTAEENLTLGVERSAFGFLRNQRAQVREALALLGHADLPLNVPVSQLSIGLQQMVEIARALITNARVVIMDEPTSSLSAADTRALFEVIRRLKERGISVIYISHFLEEVQEIADAYTVLRDGQTVGTGRMADVTIPRIIEMMVGRALDELFPSIPHAIGEPVLKVEGLEGSPLSKGISFELHRGEILGLAGLVGSGRSETVRSLFGLDRARRGALTISAQEPRETGARGMSVRRALGLGLDLLSENRKEEGLAVSMPIATNITLSSLPRFATLNGWGPLNLRREREASERWIKDLSIKCRGPRQAVSGLSGGNQQKVALARILEQSPEIIMLDEPTRGVDVGSKAEIYRLIGQLAAQGKAVIFISSYLPELFGVCDTLAVMHRGQMSPVRPIGEWTHHDVMQFATSGNTIADCGLRIAD